MDILDKLEQIFFKYVRRFLDMARGKNGKEFDDLLVEQGRDEEEKRVIREMCEETDLEHEMMTELMNSDVEPGDWFEMKIVDIIKDKYPNVTAEEIEEVKEIIRDCLENGIRDLAEIVAKCAEAIQSAEAEKDDNQEGEEDQHHE